MQKKRKHIIPNTVIGSMLLLSAYSLIYMQKILSDLETMHMFWVVVIETLAIGAMLVSIYFNVRMLANKNLQKGDEFTDAIMYKAGYYSFAFIVCSLTILFMVMHILMLDDHGDVDGARVNLGVILLIVAIIQILSATMFSIIATVLTRKGLKGESNDEQD